jgi:hypothetical protein
MIKSDQNTLFRIVFDAVDKHMVLRTSELRSDYDVLYCSISILLGAIGSYAANQIPNIKQLRELLQKGDRKSVEEAVEMIQNTTIEFVIPEERRELATVFCASIPFENLDKNALSTELVDAVFSSRME